VPPPTMTTLVSAGVNNISISPSGVRSGLQILLQYCHYSNKKVSET